MIKIIIPKASFIHHWMMKEYGSWEDNNQDVNHPCAILQKRGIIELTKEQIKGLIVSGKYQATSWEDDEIEGGARTKKAILSYTNKLSNLIS